MNPRSGTRTPEGDETRLRAVPPPENGPTAERVPACLEDADADGLVGLALLRDAATLMTARQRLDGLLLQLTVNPFDRAAYRALNSYLVGQGVLALAAHERVNASTARIS